MLVDTMTYKEMGYEFVRMYKSHLMMDTFNRLNNKNGPYYNQYRRYLIKHRQQKNVWFQPIIEELDANSKFISIPMSPGYKVFCKHGIGAVDFLVFKHHTGLIALIIMGVYAVSVAIFTSHFFDRYVERFLHGKETSRIETICRFMKNNRDLPMTAYPFKEYPYNMFGLTKDVVLLAESLDHNITLIKTCVTKDMLFSKQELMESALEKAMEQCDYQHNRLEQAIMKKDQSEINRIYKDSISAIQSMKNIMHPDDE